MWVRKIEEILSGAREWARSQSAMHLVSVSLKAAPRYTCQRKRQKRKENGQESSQMSLNRINNINLRKTHV